MKLLKPHNTYPETMSIRKKIFKGKKLNISIQEHYDPHYLNITFWTKDKDINLFVLKKWIHISLNLKAFYIAHIYPHLGKCHKDLRSRWYIGTPVEQKIKER